MHKRTTHWSKDAGRRPAKAHLAAAQTLARPGSKTAVALAMALRPEGTTQTEIKAILGRPYRNKLRDVVRSGAARRLQARPRDGLTVYRIALK